ncbi:MAG: hypothetical protein R3F47_18115 [Gammaproteobacteria bacterium]|jgi:Tfp pilus assembly protein PilN
MERLEQRINFYQDIFRKPQIRFPLQQMLLLWIGVLALLLVVTAVDFTRTRALRSELAHLQLAETRLQTAVEQLSQQLAARVVDPRLEQQDQQLRDHLSAKQRFYLALQQQGDTHDIHFSAFLDGLAQLDQQQLWLTRIGIQAPGPRLSLSGLTGEPRAVADYLAALNSQPVFNGVPFRTLSVERMAERSRYLTFTVSTQHDETATR